MSSSKIGGILSEMSYHTPIVFFIQMTMIESRWADRCWTVECLQVSNWFINARVRLWKPMVEEMYKDEFMREEAEECERDVRAEAEGEVSTKRIGKLLDMNRDQACIEAAESTDHTLTRDHSGLVGKGPQQDPVHVGVNELGLIHVYNGGEPSSSRQPDVELEVFLTMPEEFAHVDKRLRPPMPLKICKLEPKDA
jgi:hypothetical protein